MANPEVTQQTASGGYFRIFARPPGGKVEEITFVRGAPIQIQSMSSTDPFGDAVASLSFPSITGFDRPGNGDLKWLVPWTDIDIVYYEADGSPTSWKWEGFMVSEEVGEDYSIQCKGALYQADNFLAVPQYPFYPIPYEVLIKRWMNPATNTSLRTAAVRQDFPADWKITVPKFTEPSYLWFLRPWGVSPGDKWTGMTTRNTGGWEPVLSGYVQTLLSVMFTEEGQWTMMKEPGRKPVLKVRNALREPTEETLHVYYGGVGVAVSVSRDFTQSANLVYGAGTDLAGSTFSGMQVTGDGLTTYYEPFAALPQVYPMSTTNPRMNKNVTRKEVRLNFPTGMDEISARDKAADHLRRFADPGYTGSIALNSDPTKGGMPYNRQLIKAGQTIMVHGLRGTDVLFHISEATCSPADGTVTLSIDSKFRDALTVAEVKARTRDALNPVRTLRVGMQSAVTNDMIKPWSNVEGSGIIPGGAGFNATNLLVKLADPKEKFPWTGITKKYPPKKYPGYYVKIGPKSNVADNNWSGVTRSGFAYMAIPVRMSQSGTIRLSQFAAYDGDGNVMPVRFHVSLYANNGIGRRDMPRIPTAMTGVPYSAGQHYPYYKGAFEKIKDDGTQQDDAGYMLPQGAGLIVGWGNYYEGAGYYPGSSSLGSPKTGMLVDETTWAYDTTSYDFDIYSAENTRKNPSSGMIYVMFYCDDQGNQPVYFLGRLWRQQDGTTGAV